MSEALPDANEVYTRFFDRWYDDDDRERKGFSHTRPDMAIHYRPGVEPSQLCRLTPRSQAEVLRRIETMLQAARNDWPGYLPVAGELGEGWIQSFDDYYDTERVSTTINQSDASDFSNDLVVLVCELGAALGTVLLTLQPRLKWIPEWPYWESSLYDPVSGHVIPPFHWAMKKFSDYGVDDGFVPKLHMCVWLLDQRHDD